MWRATKHRFHVPWALDCIYFKNSFWGCSPPPWLLAYFEWPAHILCLKKICTFIHLPIYPSFYFLFCFHKIVLRTMPVSCWHCTGNLVAESHWVHVENPTCDILIEEWHSTQKTDCVPLGKHLETSCLKRKSFWNSKHSGIIFSCLNGSLLGPLANLPLSPSSFQN